MGNDMAQDITPLTPVKGARRSLPMVPVALALVVAVLAVAGFGYLHAQSAKHPAASTTAAPDRKGASVGSVAALTAPQLWSRAISASGVQGSVQVIQRSVSAGRSGTLTTWAGSDRGLQQISVDGGSAEVRYVGGIGYLRADAKSLEQLFGYDSTASSLAAGRWLKFTPTTPGYTELVDGTTLSAALKDFSGFTPQAVLPATTLDGQRVTPLRGTMHDAESSDQSTAMTVYVRADGAPLLVGIGTTSTEDGNTLVIFRGWGSQQTVSSPADAVAPPVVGITS